MYRYFLKRLIDLVVAIFGFTILSPVFVVVCIALFFANRGRIFFSQLRPGLHEKIFKIIKFKTMNDRRDSKGNLLPDNQRMTKIGSFIRKTSLDEIPQLLNVIMGDMSLIGPRPLLIQYLPLYNEIQKRRHEVRPGITGWAQVNGRNAISWKKKFDLDVWYVDHVSLFLDVKIIFKTVLKVFKSEGINAEGHVTIEPFKGNE